MDLTGWLGKGSYTHVIMTGFFDFGHLIYTEYSHCSRNSFSAWFCLGARGGRFLLGSAWARGAIETPHHSSTCQRYAPLTYVTVIWAQVNGAHSEPGRNPWFAFTFLAHLTEAAFDKGLIDIGQGLDFSSNLCPTNRSQGVPIVNHAT